MNDTREMTLSEKSLLLRLLSEPFPGRDELRAQVDSAKVNPLGLNNSLEFVISTEKSAAVVIDSLPVEGEVEDRDGVMIQFHLHVEQGLLNLLEIARVDGERVAGSIQLDRVRVFPSIGGFSPPKGALVSRYRPAGYDVRGGSRALTDSLGRSPHISFYLMRPDGKLGLAGYVTVEETRLDQGSKPPEEGEAFSVRGLRGRIVTRESVTSLSWLEGDLVVRIEGDLPASEMKKIAESMYWIA